MNKKQEEPIQYEYVRSMKTAALLMLQGFRLMEIQPSKKNPDFDVYCFRQTHKLTQALLKLIDNQNGEIKNECNITANDTCKND